MRFTKLLTQFLALMTAFVFAMGTVAFAQEPEHESHSPSTTSILDQHTLGQMSELIVNSNQTLVIDFAALHEGVNLSGNLTNNGSIYAYSTNPNVTSGSIGANNIFNGGLITSILPTGGIPGLSLNLASLVSNFSLNLSAVNNITNTGTISSAGNLSLSAGGTITNTGVMAGMLAQIQAANNVSMMANNIVNSGLITALQGNINIASKLASDLTINNLSGKLSALNGSINIRDVLESAKVHTTVWGGDLLAKDLNVFSGTGIAHINVNELSGMLNIKAGEAHVGSNTAALNLGTIELTGDPSFFNTSGDVVINSALTFSGQPLAIVAGRDIFTTTGAGAINTSSGSGNGGAITLIAGAQFTSSGPSSAQPPPPGDSTSTLTITGASTTGGSIRLESPAISSLTSASTGGSGNGGNITLIAFQGSDSQSGKINLPSALTISSSGNGSGTSGNVTAIAGSADASGNAITTGAINTAGGANNTGNISLTTSQPTIAGGTATVLNGTLTGSFVAGTTTNNSIATGNLTTTGANINVTAGNQVLLGSLNANATGTNNGGNITVTTNSSNYFIIGTPSTNGINGSLTANAGTNGKGGSISISNAGAGGLTYDNTVNLSVTSTGNNMGGTISLNSGSGVMTIAGSGTWTLAAEGSGAGSGGTISMTAASFGVSGPTGLLIDVSGASSGGTGNGGTINITTTSASYDLPVPVSFSTLDIRGGTTSGGAGSVNITSARNLTVDPGSILQTVASNGKGATINLTAGQDLLVTGSLSANGVGTGDGGVITLVANSATTFLIGSPTTNGINGSLTANAGTNGKGGTISATNIGTGALGYNNTVNLTVNASGNNMGGNITLNAGSGTMGLVGSGVWTLAAEGSGSGQGGTITLTAGNYGVFGVSGMLLDVSGAPSGGTGKGGTVSITSTNAVSDLPIPASFVTIDARGGSTSGGAGTVNITSARDISIDTSAMNLTVAGNGSGGTVNLTAGRNLVVTGNLNVNGVGTGAGGVITLNSNSSTAFTIGSATANSVSGTLTANAGTAGAGGSVTVQNLGSGGLTILTSATLSVNASGNNIGGTIILNAGSGVMSTSGSGALSLKAEGSGSGTGGEISLSAASYTVSGSSFGLLDASGAATGGTGTGGKVTLTATSASFDLSISSSVFQIDIRGGSTSGAAGEANITSGRDINLTTSSLTNTVTSNGAGATISISAGRNIVVTGNLNANGVGNGAGGKITLNSNSSTNFNIFGGGSNGTNGTITANAGTTSGDGGQITITNAGSGGILFANGYTLTANTSAGGGNGGKIQLTAADDITFRDGTTFNVNAAGTGVRNGGQIVFSALDFNFQGAGNGVLATANASGTGTGGDIFITSTGSVANITIQPGGGDFQVSATGGSAGSSAGDGGRIVVAAGNNLTVDVDNINANPLGAGKGARYELYSGMNASTGLADIDIQDGTLAANANTGGDGGSITIQAGIFSGNGRLNFDAGGTVQANGVGNGNGGSISITTSSTSNFQINGSGTNRTRGPINANAGATSGKGGSITVRNLNGDILLGSVSNLSVAASTGAAGGNGGSITLLSSAALNLAPGTFSLNAIGTGGTTGGTVSLQGATISTGGALTINANGNQSGSGTGLGGTVSITATASTGDITVNASNFVINTRGGTTGGDGGTISLTAGRNLAVTTSSLNASPTGGNSKGGDYTFVAANAGAGTLQITGSLAANGINNGNGGTINLTYSDATNPFVIGNTVTNSGITGNLTATAPGSGTGGTITITNSATASINLSLTGTLSVASTSGTNGQINVFKPGQAIQILGTAGAGTVNGIINGTGTSVLIQPNATNVAMSVGNLTSTAGGITLRATGSGSSISVSSGSTVSASGGNILIETFSVSNRGTITSNFAGGSITIQSTGALTLTGAGTVTQTGTGTPSILIEAVGANALNMNGGWVYNAGSSGTVTFRSQNASGSITTGAGSWQLVEGGSTLTISTPLLSLGSGSLINNYKTSGTAITINNGTAIAALTVSAPSSSFAVIGTRGGDISIAPSNNQELVFDKTSGTAATLNLNTLGIGSITTTTNAATTINPLVTVAPDNSMTMNVNGGNIATINGTATISKANSTLTIQSSTSLTLAGTGTLSSTGTGEEIITVQAQGANSLTVAGSLNYIADSNDFVRLQSAASGGSVIVNSGTTQSGSGGLYMQLIAPQITFNGAAAINNSNGYLDLTGDQLATNITLTNNTTVNVNLGSAIAFIGSYATQALTINKTAGAQTSTLQVNNEVQTFSYGANTTIETNVRLASTGNITVNVDGGTLMTNGTITTSAVGGIITLGSFDDNTTLSGAPQGITATGGGASAIIVQAGGTGHTLAINSSYSFDAGSNGTTTLFGDNLTTAASTTLTISGGTLSYFGQNITLGSASTVSGVNGVAFFASGGVNTLTITLPDSSSAAIGTTAGQIHIQGQTIIFAKSAGAGLTQLNLNNSPVFIQSINGNTEINNSVTLQASHNITMQINGGVSLVNNGTIKSTRNSGVIDISGNVSLTIGGTTTGTIQVSGTGSNSISITGFVAGLTLNNSLILDAGAAGTAFIGAANGTMTMAANKTITFANQTAGSVQANTLLLSGNNTITGTKTSGTALSIFSPSPSPLALNLQANTTSTFATSGGAIAISSPMNVTIGINGGGPMDTATLNLTGGPATITSNQGTTVVSARVTINASNDLTFNVNSITVGANGEINTSFGSISLIASTGTISIGNNVTMFANEGNLTIQNTDTSGGTINIASGADLTGFTLSNPVLGFVNIVIGPIPSMPVVGTVPANVIVNESGGGVVYFGTNSINAAAPDNTINAKGRNVIFNTGNLGPTAITLGGGVTITADPPLPVDTIDSSITSNVVNPVAFNSNNIVAEHSSIFSSVIPFDTSPASTVENEVFNDTINNVVNQAMNDSGVLAARKRQDEDQPVVYHPISYSPSQVRSKKFILDNNHRGLYTVETAGAVIKCISVAKVSILDAGTIKIKSGEALIVTTKQEQRILVGHWQVLTSPYAAIVVSYNNGILKVTNIYDRNNHSITVVTTGGAFNVGTGEEIMIADDEGTISHAMDNDKLGRRRTKSRTLPSTRCLAHSEISLVSLLENNATVNQMVLSHDPEDRQLADRVLKTAASLMIATHGHGPYHGKVSK